MPALSVEHKSMRSDMRLIILLKLNLMYDTLIMESCSLHYIIK